MLAFAASLLVAATAASTDFSSACLTELGYGAVPTNGAHLFLYRRCINTKKKLQDLEEENDADMQRLDQNFWKRKDAADKRRDSLLRQSESAIKAHQKKRSLAVPSPKSRRAIIQNAARSRNRALRLEEQKSE